MRLPPRFLYVAAAALGVFLATAGMSSAQPSESRLELGLHLSTVRLGESGDMNAGLGGRVSYDVSRWFALELEGSFFPAESFNVPVSRTVEPSLTLRHHRKRVEAFVGPKITMRGGRLGAFVRVRPGVTRGGDAVVDCEGPACPLVLLVRPEYRNELALDAGGGIELYPNGRTVVRIDLGDLIVRHRSDAPPCRSCTTHNFQSRLGFGLRF